MKIINPWLILGVLGLLVASFGLGYYSGWQGKIDDYEADITEAAKDSRIGNEKVNKGYDITSKEIRKVPAGNCVGPRVGAGVEWLSDNYRK